MPPIMMPANVFDVPRDLGVDVGSPRRESDPVAMRFVGNWGRA
jgi:hypothetical protein